ncbi:MAG: 4Fe-4S dicluster domain-containing protein [Planctomycetota bacterium]
MKNRLLKGLRITIAAVFIVAITASFVDLTGLLSPTSVRGVLGTQFVPSILRFSRVYSLAAAGFMAIIILTLLFGRIYCSCLCPLGILQDLLRSSGRWLGARKFTYQEPHHRLRGVLLLILLGTLVSGNMLVLSLLDPYSLFGRISSALLRPLAVWGNNLLASLLQARDIYTLSQVDLVPLHWALYAVTVIFLGIISVLAVRHGRIYCNTICPVGTVLGYLSRFSIFNIRIAEKACTRCGACERVCKAECIDVEQQRIDLSRCVTCFNCLTACNFDALHFAPGAGTEPESEEQPVQSERREVMNVMLGGLLLGAVSDPGIDVEVTEESDTKVTDRRPSVPPGALEMNRFLDRCSACHLCVSTCPTGVIQPSTDEFGWSHMMQVRMDFQTAYCNYECTRCTEVCPTGALDTLPAAEKKRTQIGRANFIEDNCIVVNQGTACGACAEHCPTGALSMVIYEDHLTIPEVNQDVCIGCGACEYICPARPNRAMYVDGNLTHVRSRKRPPIDGEDAEGESEDDFPF